MNGLCFRKGLFNFSEEENQVVYKNADTNPQLVIENSDLGKANFIDCNLLGFDLYFKSSKITDVFVTGTKMPKNIVADSFQKQLVFSQIKKIYEARGDRVEANRYFAKEMESYQTTFSWQTWDGFWEKLNLTLNRISTDYGQSWQRGLGTTLYVSFLFYIVYCGSLGYLLAKPTKENLTQFWNIMSYFLEFVNPIHKADYIAEQLLGTSYCICGWARIIEGVSRVFIAYFGYQLIQAFRKHGKASG